ncbi:hypothetical protein HPP92_012253 [Vanilla planifolia]|uniref:PHD-type domain-containing protein n=1 Tax=Vanilla planifolia TaxID=51239 RepID=A0A835R4J8_VANPL|nr:hypothetical protein HPP92_012253 [Vanilla planifolia]
MELNQSIGYEKFCRLSNSIHSEIAPSLSLPSLPVSLGAADPALGLFDDASGHGVGGDRPDVLVHASTIASLLRECDVSYLNLNRGAKCSPCSSTDLSKLYHEVIGYNALAFECSSTGPFQAKRHQNTVEEQKPFIKNVLTTGQVHYEVGGIFLNQFDNNIVHDQIVSAGSTIQKVKKEIDSRSLSSGPGPPAHEDILGDLCEMFEDFCGKAEVPDDLGGVEGPSIPLADIKMLINELIIINVLDHQIQSGQGLSINEDENSSAEVLQVVLHALEATHAVLIIMTHHDMPKQLYKEEVIERIVDFSRFQIMEVMAACNPFYQSPHKTNENGEVDGDEEEDDVIDNGLVGKKRRNQRTISVKKSATNKVPAAVHAVAQKLCSILDLIKDLLSAVRLSDSCIFQLLKASISTFLVDNIQLLQLKSINLLCGLFPKLQFSKRSLRAYHLPDEEHKQIQMVTALLIQLAQCGANLPEAIKTASTFDAILSSSVDVKCPYKCLSVANTVSCALWTKVIERCTNTKSQDLSESKLILENLVMDLLTTLNLPEYPASASILQVLCVVLLQNAGLKSKDISARCLAVDILGVIAARLKRDSAARRREKFWILQDLTTEDADASSEAKDSCCICFSGKGMKIVCQGCHKLFHADCLGASGEEMTAVDWVCHVCLCKNQLSLLQSYCKHGTLDNAKPSRGVPKNASKASDSIKKLDVLHQILLNFLEESSPPDDTNLFARWFYLSLWHKDDALSVERVTYLIARLKMKVILRCSEGKQRMSRNWAKKICLVLGQNHSFSRGFDTILTHLLASLREGSSILRAKALRAVSAIVEADPEVLCDERVQAAVEGRFCDSAISVQRLPLNLLEDILHLIPTLV